MPAVFITGTTSGIGLETSLEFARLGWQVFAGIRNPDRAKDLEAAARAESLDLNLVEGDVTDEGAVKAAIDSVMSQTDRLDAVINNAGRVVIAPIEETDADEASAVFEANFFGALHVIRAVMPIMREQRGGTIVNISSIGARVAPSYYGVYAASKRAMEAVSEALQLEAEPFGIRVVLIEPGNFRTNIMKSALIARRFGEDSPYLEGLQAMKADAKKVYENIQADSAPGPELVAKAIVNAITTDDSKFAYAVGEDAKAFLEALRDAPPDQVPFDIVGERLLGEA